VSGFVLVIVRIFLYVRAADAAVRHSDVILSRLMLQTVTAIAAQRRHINGRRSYTAINMDDGQDASHTVHYTRSIIHSVCSADDIATCTVDRRRVVHT